MANDGLSAGAAARRLGVAVTTLRTWHQRYGLGPSSHEPGHHRRYTVEDMGRLHVMQRLTAQGVAPAEAAAWARRSPAPASVTGVSPPDTPGAPDPQSAAGVPGRAGPDSRPAPGGVTAGPRPGPADPARPAEPAPTDRESVLALIESGVLIPDPGEGPIRGEPTIALGPRADPVARGLARAAMRLDAPSMRHILDSAITDRGVVSAWNSVVMPVLIGVGEQYEATKRFIEVEHLLSRAVTEALSTVPRPPRDVVPRVLLAATEEEQHTLPLEALAAALAEHGVPSRLLGARVPVQALLETVDRTDPAVVVLWAQLPGTGNVIPLEHLLSRPRPPIVIAAAGPGWLIADLPPMVTPLSGLAEAVRVVCAAVS